ncbi:hypothetical protein PUN28_014980 [Cardiocondyla obscurior]|uniref:Uncharacterized protein n=1 Tax=Cardiocondyla obscurior TaxID=286306 RepID=A0AAW2F066_9HYME
MRAIIIWRYQRRFPGLVRVRGATFHSRRDIKNACKISVNAREIQSSARAAHCSPQISYVAGPRIHPSGGYEFAGDG